VLLSLVEWSYLNLIGSWWCVNRSILCPSGPSVKSKSQVYLCASYEYLTPVMESRDLASVLRRVSKPVSCSLSPGLGLEGLKSRLGLEGFWSRSWALRLETLHKLFFVKFCKEFFEKTVLKNDCSKFSRSKRSVSLLLYCLRVGENNLPSTPFKIYTEFNKKCARTNETAGHNLCNERLGVLC